MKNTIRKVPYKNWRHIHLYPDDFRASHIWESLCDSVKVSSDAEKITLFYDKTLTKEKIDENSKND